MKHADRSSVRGKNARRAKDYITGYVCTIGTGVLVPMCIIENSKNPRCFRIEKSLVPYRSQQKSLPDTFTFHKWFQEILLPFIRGYTSHPGSIFTDNCSPHEAKLNDPKEQGTIMTLPPSCTALHQSMDMGIISTWNLNYCSLLIRATVDDWNPASSIEVTVRQWSEECVS